MAHSSYLYSHFGSSGSTGDLGDFCVWPLVAMVVHHFKRHASGLLPAAIATIAFFTVVYFAIIRAAKAAADDIMEKCGHITSIGV